MLNAARHSGAPSVSVYLEVRDDDAVVFVRDRGRGFDPAAVGEDRGGIAASIVGRLARNGGRRDDPHRARRGLRARAVAAARKVHDDA